MYIEARAAVHIADVTPERVWDYASDPAHWTASNPDDHLGLVYDTPDNRPATGATFRQRERVAGVLGDLRGRFQWVHRPHVAVWTGVAHYRLVGGLLRPRIPEGGTVWTEPVEGGVIIHHDVFMDFPDTLWGRVLAWAFVRLRDGRRAVREHTERELQFFRQVLEGSR